MSERRSPLSIEMQMLSAYVHRSNDVHQRHLLLQAETAEATAAAVVVAEILDLQDGVVDLGLEVH